MANTPAAATRKNVKTSTRYNDTMEKNGWNVMFDYEKVDGVLSDKMSAQATKEGKSVFISKNQGNLSVNFSNGTAFDSALVDAINAEFLAIEA